MTVASIIFNARRARAMSLAQVAAQSDMSTTAVWNIEQGVTRSPGFYHCLRLCATLGINLDVLIAATLVENLPADEPDPTERIKQRLEGWRLWGQSKPAREVTLQSAWGNQPTTQGESHAQ